MKTVELVVYINQNGTDRHNTNIQQASVVETADTYEGAIKKCHEVAFSKYGVTSDDVYKIRKC